MQERETTFVGTNMSCITLLSDLGLHDASVASAKGILMQYAPNTTIVDISHFIEPYHLQQAAYLMAAAHANFAADTFHLVLFDIFSTKTPQLLLYRRNNQYFFAPDNGILSLAFGNSLQDVWKCFELDSSGMLRDWVREAGKTIQRLQNQSPEELNLEKYGLKNAPTYCQPKIENSVVECQVIHIDRFENVVINITKEQFYEAAKDRPFQIQFMRNETINEISTHYHNVKEGDKLCRFNSAGYLEISINRGNAASLFGLKLYREQHLMYNTIKIFFG